MGLSYADVTTPNSPARVPCFALRRLAKNAGQEDSNFFTNIFVPAPAYFSLFWGHLRVGVSATLTLKPWADLKASEN